jgi:hypothetical protein
MTTKDAFSPEEWKLVLEGPTSAGMLIVTASHGGSFRETFAMSKAYAEARAQHGESQLLDQIVATRPKTDHKIYHSPEELKSNELQHIRDAVALVEREGTPQEVEEYRRFILTLADKVASAHRESGQTVSPAEADAVQQIQSAVGVPAS